MGIFSRLSDIINSNINALLEKAEDPEKIVRLIIQEMEDTLVEVRSNAAKAIAEKKERSRQLTYLEQEQIDWEQKAELALSKDRDDLARAALTEKAKVGDQIDVLKKELDAINGTLKKLNEDITKLQAKLNDAKNRQRAIVMRHKTAQSQLKVRSQIHNQKIDDVLSRFELAEKRIDSVESEAESLDMGRKRGMSEEIADLETDDRVQDELEALKAKLSKKSGNAGDAEPKAKDEV